jgi:hypothetical protein
MSEGRVIEQDYLYNTLTLSSNLEAHTDNTLGEEAPERVEDRNHGK